jgi:hypothetical protein
MLFITEAIVESTLSPLPKFKGVRYKTIPSPTFRSTNSAIADVGLKLSVGFLDYSTRSDYITL